MQNYDIPLHDIKPLVEIQEYSLYYLIALSALSTVIFLGIIYLTYRWWNYKNRFDIRKEHFKLLNSVDLSDAKKASYDITFYGYIFKDDSQRHTRAYQDLVERLEKYKYKKSVEPFDDETLHQIELYRGMIDV
jgi:hypothetical protein